MELRHLRYFLAVADERSISRAAVRLFIAQPALSRQIRDLERHLGVPLFDRSHHGVGLTEHGERLLPRARAVVGDADEAVRRVRAGGAEEEPARPLRLGVSVDAAARILPYLRAARAICPDLDVEVVEQAYDGPLVRAVDRKALDVAVVWIVEPDRAANARTLVAEDLVGVVPEAVGGPTARPMTVEELRTGGALAFFDRELGRDSHDALAAMLRGAAGDPHLVGDPCPGDRGAQWHMVRSAAANGLSTVVTGFNWATRLRTDGLVAHPLQTGGVPVSLLWGEGRAAEGTRLAVAVVTAERVRRSLATVDPG